MKTTGKRREEYITSRTNTASKVKRILLGALLLYAAAAIAPPSAVAAPKRSLPRVSRSRDWSALHHLGIDERAIAGVAPSLIRWVIADLTTGEIAPEQAKAFLATAPAMPQYGDAGPVLPVAAWPPLFGHYLPSTAPATRTCRQAWNGPGTGAWYRVDTDCRFGPWPATSYELHFGNVTYGPGRADKEGIYQSLGLFNAATGAGGDIGFMHVKDADGTYRWVNYGADGAGWKYGAILIDPAQHPSIDVLLEIPARGSLQMTVRDHRSGRALGSQTFSQWHPSLDLTPAGTNIGWYRFDSIAQNPENKDLKSGSKLVDARTNAWTLYAADGWSLALPGLIAPEVFGYAPGKCCSAEEQARIDVRFEARWYASTVDIHYD